jgi:hypothetical protein
MNKSLKILSALLGLQLVLAGAVYFKTRQGSYAEANESLLRIGADEFDQVVITEPGKPAVTVSKIDGRWILPGRWDFPVSAEKISLTFDKLRELRKSWPVGDTAAARTRYKVTEEVFEKKVVFLQGGKEKKTLYLGTSPEFRKVHFRPSDRDGVYLAEFGYHDLAMTPAEWEDKRFLSLDRSRLMQIETPDVQLVNGETGFQANGLKPGEESKTAEVESFISQITNLTYLELTGTSPTSAEGLDSPAYKVTVRTKDGQTIVFDFGKPKTGEDFFLKSSAHPYIFKIAKTTVDGLKSFTRSKLTTTKSS